MISHNEARAILRTLTGDSTQLARLADYIDAQQDGPRDWDRLSDREHSIRAANRAVEAISRVGTLNSDLSALVDRVATIEETLALVVEHVLSGS